MKEYNPRKIELKWQKEWAKNPKLYATKEKSSAEKAYILDMFPYPSSDGLHTGHVESYTATDIISRYLRMKGKNVLRPQGWDAFGLPAENFAIKTKTHPAITTEKAIANYKKQMDMLGFSYDWSREINSSDPSYYKWTQWFFLLLYKNGLAYRAEANVNWCESCQTVLANEQVESGVCERCKNEVKQKKMKQWFFKITNFIEPSFAPQSGVSEGQEQRKTSGLLGGLDKVDWPESTKTAQKNWIGKSEGAVIRFPIVSQNNAEYTRTDAENSQHKLASSQREPVILEVFTTRLDTIFGCTYCVVAPEHEIILKIKKEQVRCKQQQILNISEVENYIAKSKKKSELQRMAEQKEKTGVEVKGIKAVNPFNKEEIPIFVADYVLMNYGTGAVMAVPAHDPRDRAFAEKYNLRIKRVIKPGIYFDIDTSKTDIFSVRKIVSEYRGDGAYLIEDGEKTEIFTPDHNMAFVIREKLNQPKSYPFKPDVHVYSDKETFPGFGILRDSENFSGLYSEEAIKKMTKWLEKNKLGERKINYKLRDWLISRQRYWGAPIPIIHCEKCGEVAVPEKDLPVELPDDVDFMPTGESPLARSKKFQNVKCPKCGEKARRESDTMDTFVCSSWYYFRYADPKNKKEFAGKKAIKKWLPVDLYVGGAEHTVLHLLYSRFFTKVLHNLGYIDFDEPFLKLRHQGMILAEDGRKMSKSLGNVINPDEIVERFGADALRMYEMFMGPLEDAKPWNTNGIIGICRFLERTYNYIYGGFIHSPFRDEKTLKQWINGEIKGKTPPEVKTLLNKTIKKVEDDIKNLKFNTAISQLMVLRNSFYKLEYGVVDAYKQIKIKPVETGRLIAKSDFEKFLIMFSPFAPHLAEELWEKLEHKKSIFYEKWPEYDVELIKEKTFELVVQINGKVRDKIPVAIDISEDEAKEMAMKSEKIQKWLEGKEIKKVVFVKNRLINLII